jgi:hypothetical protein
MVGLRLQERDNFVQVTLASSHEMLASLQDCCKEMIVRQNPLPGAPDLSPMRSLNLCFFFTQALRPRLLSAALPRLCLVVLGWFSALRVFVGNCRTSVDARAYIGNFGGRGRPRHTVRGQRQRTGVSALRWVGLRPSPRPNKNLRYRFGRRAPGRCFSASAVRSRFFASMLADSCLVFVTSFFDSWTTSASFAFTRREISPRSPVLGMFK